MMHYNKEPRVVVTIHLPVSLVERINDIVPKWAMDNNLNPAKSKTRWYMEVLDKALDEYVLLKGTGENLPQGVISADYPPGVIAHEYLYAIGRSDVEGFISGPFETLEKAKQDIVFVNDGDVLYELCKNGDRKPLYVSKNGEWTDDF